MPPFDRRSEIMPTYPWDFTPQQPVLSPIRAHQPPWRHLSAQAWHHTASWWSSLQWQDAAAVDSGSGLPPVMPVTWAELALDLLATCPTAAHEVVANRASSVLLLSRRLRKLMVDAHSATSTHLPWASCKSPALYKLRLVTAKVPGVSARPRFNESRKVERCLFRLADSGSGVGGLGERGSITTARLSISLNDARDLMVGDDACDTSHTAQNADLLAQAPNRRHCPEELSEAPHTKRIRHGFEPNSEEGTGAAFALPLGVLGRL